MKEQYLVCILCHNLFFLETLFKNMPKQAERISFCIANDSRVIDLQKQIKQMLKKYNFANKFYFVSDGKVNEFCKRDLKLSDDAKNFVDINTMCMNQNLPYYFMFGCEKKFDKLLMLDDDVLINGDLLEIFKFDKPIYNYNGLNTGKWDKSEFIQEYLKIANVDIEKWKTHNINSGVRLYCLNNAQHKKIYANCLKQYFESKVLKDYYKVWVDSNKTKGKGKAFFQDQFFESAFAWRVDCHNSILDKYCRILYVMKLKDKKLYRSKIICHYCLPAWQKELFLKELSKEGIIDV